MVVVVVLVVVVWQCRATDNTCQGCEESCQPQRFATSVAVVMEVVIVVNRVSDVHSMHGGGGGGGLSDGGGGGGGKPCKSSVVVVVTMVVIVVRRVRHDTGN